MQKTGAFQCKCLLVISDVWKDKCHYFAHDELKSIIIKYMRPQIVQHVLIFLNDLAIYLSEKKLRVKTCKDPSYIKELEIKWHAKTQKN